MDRAKVLFLCVGNSCRSQMAEAIAKHIASDVIEASSAGISPFGRIADLTRTVLLEKGIALDGQFSKGTDHASLFAPDLIINMTGISGKALFPADKCEDWDVLDPFGEQLEVYRQIYEDIEERISDLAIRLREERNTATK